MSHDEVELSALETESNVPEAPLRAALWGAGIGACALAVLFLLLTTDLILGREPPGPGLVAPATVGEWSAAAPDLSASVGEEVGEPLDAIGVRQHYTAVYGSGDSPALVLLGGTGETLARNDDGTVLDALRDTSVAFVPGTEGDDKTVLPTEDVDPGAHGGRAACTPVEYRGARYAVCAWRAGGIALGVLFAAAPDDPGAALRVILNAVVT